MILTNGQLEMNVEFPLKYFRGYIDRNQLLN